MIAIHIHAVLLTGLSLIVRRPVCCSTRRRLKSNLEHENHHLASAELLARHFARCISTMQTSEMFRRATPQHPHLSGSALPLTLLLRHTNGPAATARCFRMLTTYTQTPVVSQTAMRTDLLQSLQVFAQLRVHTVGQNLLVFAIHNVALSIEEPRGNLVLKGVLDDRNNALEFFRS